MIFKFEQKKAETDIEQVKDALILINTLFYDCKMNTPFMNLYENSNYYIVSNEWRELFIFLLERLSWLIRCKYLNSILLSLKHKFWWRDYTLVVNKNNIIQLLYIIDKINDYLRDSYKLNSYINSSLECACAISDIINKSK